MSRLDRLYRYRSLFASRHAVSSEELCSLFQVSLATVKRDMQMLREQMHVPVSYDRLLGGYRVTPAQGRREVPGLWLSPQELVALGMLQQLLVDMAPGLLAQQLAPLRARLQDLLHDIDLDGLQLARRLRVVHAGQRRVPPAAFDVVAAATLARQRLLLRHLNRAEGRSLERVVSPQQLVHYRDNWYLDAWCHLRQAHRCFAVDALEHVTALQGEVALDMPEDTLRALTQSAYGIFSGAAKDWATLRFTPERARWVGRERWHEEQVERWLPDGSFELQIPYADDRELIGDILRFGADCEVLGPAPLRRRVAQALQAASLAYADDAPSGAQRSASRAG